MSAEASNAWSQLLSLGVVWVTLHCAGMCGPIVTGLDVAGHRRGAGALARVGRVLAYQGGRAVTYLALGATAGLVGASVTQGLRIGGALVGFLVAAVMATSLVLQALRARRAVPLASKDHAQTDLVTLGTSKVAPHGTPPRVQLRAAQRAAQFLAQFLGPVTRSSSWTSVLMLGSVMGLLPCMLTLWVLGLAAVTGSPLHGAGLMLTLVVMTTPMMLTVTSFPRLLRGRLQMLSAIAPRLTLGLSSAWMVLVSAAGIGWIDHAHSSVTVLGHDYVMMFW